MPEIKSSLLLQDWMLNLTGRAQGAILCSLRSCDTGDTPEIKRMVHWIRKTALRDVNPGSHFMSDAEFIRVKSIAEDNGWMLDQLPVHFFVHLMQGFEAIAYGHPDEEISSRALEAYTDLCQFLNLNPETMTEWETRLRDRL